MPRKPNPLGFFGSIKKEWGNMFTVVWLDKPRGSKGKIIKNPQAYSGLKIRKKRKKGKK